MSFDNYGYLRIYFSDNLWITINDTIIGVWILGLVLITFAIIVRIKIKNFKEVPETGFQNIVELLVEFFNNLTEGIMSTKYKYFANWFFGVFMVLLFSNISGIFGLRPPSADLTFTFPIAFTTVVLMAFIGLRHNTKGYVKGLFAPVFIFFPMNVIGDVSKSVSLSVRLFANIFAGTVIMGLIYGLLPRIFTVLIPAGLSLYFDLFAGALHAYIFTILSMYFMMMKVPEPE